MQVSVLLLNFCKTTASPHKILLKSGNQLLSYGKKNVLVWLPYTILSDFIEIG